MSKIEGVGNTVDEAFKSMMDKVAKLLETQDVECTNIVKYGNFESGYKIVYTYKSK